MAKPRMNQIPEMILAGVDFGARSPYLECRKNILMRIKFLRKCCILLFCFTVEDNVEDDVISDDDNRF